MYCNNKLSNKIAVWQVQSDSQSWAALKWATANLIYSLVSFNYLHELYLMEENQHPTYHRFAFDSTDEVEVQYFSFSSCLCIVPINFS
uniref:Uncharacterized protein n=1 Tax=Picea sitchensis TaxID=3332 RepID=D5AB02_PICSI|nr:unknown [Picea sitchensis]